MGGAIAVRVAAKRALPTLAGLVVVDVVEVRCIYSREMSFLQLTICSVKSHQFIVERAVGKNCSFSAIYTPEAFCFAGDSNGIAGSYAANSFKSTTPFSIC
jgi:protein phosphatase methylesterase 1